MSGNQKQSDDGVGCLVAMIIAFIAMPIVGIYLLGQEEEEKKFVGGALLVVGIILWIMLGANS